MKSFFQFQRSSFCNGKKHKGNVNNHRTSISSGFGFRSSDLIVFCVLVLCLSIPCESEGENGLEDGNFVQDDFIENKFVKNEFLLHNNASSLSDIVSKLNPEIRRKCDFERDAKDIGLSTPNLIVKLGFPVEVHHVMSADGYILELHRISNPGRPVFIAFHGMLMTSREWLLNCDGRSLPIKLAKANYDVWLANARGNRYSSHHVNLTINDAKYWAYSVDELIKYDAPAIIDYTLKVTGQTKVNWFGWSLGSAVIMGLMSSQPEYNDKLNLAFTVGTVAYVGNTKSPLFRLWSLGNKLQDRALTRLNKGRFLPSAFYPILHNLLPSICMPEARRNSLGICSALIFLLDGYNPGQVNSAYYPMALSSFPSTGSIKMLNQWFQWIVTNRFGYYDFGRRMNMVKYGTAKPPEYNLSRFTGRVVNFWSDNDWISTPRDVQKTVESLPNVIHNIRIDHPQWNHFDYGLGKDADVYVYDIVIDMLNRYT